MNEISYCCRGSDVTEADVAAARVGSDKDLLSGTHTKFYCCGSPHRVGIYGKRHGMYEGADENPQSGLELALEAKENEDFDVVKIIQPNVPYVEELHVNLHVGTSLEIHGRTQSDCNRFTINLSTGNSNDSDIGLHFNPRFDRKIVVRNHRICNKWGLEEIVSVQPFPFRYDKSFSILIFIVDEQFMISINKIHYCAFSFRIPIENLAFLIITGDITLNLIHYSTREFYPPRIFSKKPYIIVPQLSGNIFNRCEIRRKIKALTTGSKIEIFGRVKLLPRGFYVNIQQGLDMWPHPIIPFHMNLRVNPPGTSKKEFEVIFNSWLRGNWEKETILTHCPFMPGLEFHMTVECSPTCYLVSVNGKFLYKHGRTEERHVDSVLVYGDVVIRKVVIRKITGQSSSAR